MGRLEGSVRGQDDVALAGAKERKCNDVRACAHDDNDQATIRQCLAAFSSDRLSECTINQQTCPAFAMHDESTSDLASGADPSISIHSLSSSDAHFALIVCEGSL